MDLASTNLASIQPRPRRRDRSAHRLIPALLAGTLLLAACGGSSDSSPTSAEPAPGAAESSEVAEQPSAPSAPDLTPDELCDLVPAEDLVAVLGGELDSTEALDSPPQCSVIYGNSQALRDEGAANGTNLLVFAPTREDLEGKSGQEAMDVATQYAFFDSDPEPVDVADGGLSNGKFLYFFIGGRIVGIAAGDGTSPEQLIELAEVAAGALAP